MKFKQFMIKYFNGERVYQYVCGLVCFVVAALCLYPLLYTLAVSVCAPENINYSAVLPIPTKFSLRAYMQVFTVGDYIWRAILVSVFRTVVGTFLSVVVCAMLAYALSRRDLPGKRGFMYLLIFIILFQGGLIPTFLVIKEVNLLNNIWVYVLPNIMNAWNVIIMKQSMEGIPREIEESARMDGVSDLQNFVLMVLPMSTPVLAAMAIFTLVGQWNSWFDAMIYVTSAHSDLWPLQYYATISLNNLNQINANNPNPNVNNFTALMEGMSVKMALTVVTTLPILVMYPFFQKYFTKGVYLGAVKG